MLNQAKQILPTASVVQGMMNTVGHLSKRQGRADNDERLQFANSQSVSFDYSSENCAETSFGSLQKDNFREDLQFQRHESKNDVESQIPNSASATFQKPKISSWDAGWNVTNAIQGMFVLGLPYAIMHGGYLGLLLIVLTAVICCYTGRILVECLYEENEAGELIRVRNSYFEIAELCWGRRLGGVLVNVAQLIELIMTCVLYIVVSGNLMANCFPFASVSEAGWSTLVTLVLAPCIFLKNLRAVSKLSMGCTLAQIIVIGMTIVYCFSKISTWAWSEISIGINVRQFPVSIGVIVFSYTSQIFLPSVEGSMENRGSFKPMLYWSYAASCMVKFFFALFCFLTWSKDTKEVITDNLPTGLRAIINIVLVIKALLSYPLPYYASVEVLEQTVFTGATGGFGSLFRTKAHPYEDLSNCSSTEFSPELTTDVKTMKSNSLTLNETTRLKSSGMILFDNTEKSPPSGLPSCYKADGGIQIWAYLLRLGLVLTTFLVAIFIPHFALLMGLTGSLTGASLAFIFPCAFYLQLKWKTLQWKIIIFNLIIIAVGFVCSVSGIYHSIEGLIAAYQSSAFPTYFNSTGNATLDISVTTPIPDLILFNEPGPMPQN